MKLEPDKAALPLPGSAATLRSQAPPAGATNHPLRPARPSPASRLAKGLIGLLALLALALTLAGHSYGVPVLDWLSLPSRVSEPGSARAFAAGAEPLVRLDYGLFRGRSNGEINSWYNIPFALPPTGIRRFQPAQPIPPLSSPSLPPITDATEFGPSCYQQKQEDIPVVGAPWHLRPPLIPRPLRRQGNVVGGGERTSDSSGKEQSPQSEFLDGGAEDCLSLVVHAPAADGGGDEGGEWPVVVWLFGGGFQIGAINQYDGLPIVARSLSEGTPIVYVAPNYRLNGFGFLAGREVDAEGVGNLGLRDQQAALQWVQRYIHLFGGDPRRVTLWGESAGAMSASLHMLAPSSWPLFHRVWLNSGSPIPIRARTKDEIDDRGQTYFDQLALKTGCGGVPEGLRLGCLKRAPFEQLAAAIDDTPDLFAYNSLNLPWIPRVDGVFLTNSTVDLLNAGKVARVPVVSGDCDDEGTLFSLSQANITTSSHALAWIQRNYLPEATASEMARLAELYPADPTRGSPFDTGYLNQLSPQFKRLAALQGDLVFQAPRRFFLAKLAPERDPDGEQDQPGTWSFIYKRGKQTAIVGAFHGLELENEFYAPQRGAASDFAFMDYLIAFIATADPNAAKHHRSWPQWTRDERQMLALVDRITTRPLDPLPGVSVSGLQVQRDDFRREQIEFIIELGTKYPM